MRAISSIPKNIDAYLVPLGIKLGKDEKKCKAGLAENARGITLEQASNYEFEKFPLEELERDMVLVAPRKVTAFVPTNVKPEKEKKKRASTGTTTGPKTVKSRVSRQHEMEQASHFVKEDSADAVQGAMARKIARTGSSAAMQGPAEQVMTSTDVKVPKNFFAIINVVFTVFWTMEFDEPIHNQAFFANIDKANCSHYGLTNYAETPMSFSVIRDRLLDTQEVERLGGHVAASSNTNKEVRHALNRSYKSIEDFSSDFTLLFKNISMYFPKESIVHAKSAEIEKKFTETWEEEKKKFRWK